MLKSIVKMSIFAMLTGCTLSGGPDVTYVMENRVSFIDAAKWKEGEDCASWVLFLGPFGTKSLVNATRNGKIRKLAYYETSLVSYGVYTKSCIIAYGR